MTAYAFELGITTRLGRKINPELSPTLRANAGDNQPVVMCLSQAGRRERLDVSTDSKCFSILAAAGTGGGNVPMIIDNKIYSMANCDHTLTLYGTNVSPTLTQRMGTGGNQVPVFIEKDTEITNNKQTVYSFDSLASNSMKSKNPNSGCHITEIAETLDTTNTDPSKNQGGVAIVENETTYAFAQNQRGEVRLDTSGKSYALSASEGSRPGQSKPCIVEGIDMQGGKHSANAFTNICPTMATTHGDMHAIVEDNKTWCIAGNTIDRQIQNGGNGKGWQEDIGYTLNTIDRHAISSTVESRIRRLTPVECERLQGLPDDYTNVSSYDKKGKEKPASDANRYKAIGNGMAQPCADFVIRQITMWTT